MSFVLEGAHNAEFILSEAAGERSRALITVPSGQGKIAPGALLKVDGTKAADYTSAAVINVNWVDATDADQPAAVVSRDAEVHGEFLAWPAGATDANKVSVIEALAARGILVRWTTPPAGVAFNGGDAGVVPPAEEEGGA